MTDAPKIETVLLDGRKLAQAIRAEVGAEIRRLGLSPGLGVVLVGDDPASRLYVGLKEKACAEAGIRFHLVKLNASTSQPEIDRVIRELCQRDDIDAVMVQFPLPPGLDAESAIEAIDPAKDVDSFRPDAPVASPLIEGILELVRLAKIDPVGHQAQVWANSPVFRQRLCERLTTLGFGVGEPADLAIVAVGKPKWLTREKVRAGGVVIDAGTNRQDGHVVGDTDAESLMGYVAAMSPVPGGVGPLTVAMLLKNVLRLSFLRRQESST